MADSSPVTLSYLSMKILYSPLNNLVDVYSSRAYNYCHKSGLYDFALSW